MNNMPGLAPMLWNHVVAGQRQDQVVQQIDNEVAQKGVAAQLRIAGGEGDFDAQRGDDQALMQR